jgi:hypothetical protein
MKIKHVKIVTAGPASDNSDLFSTIIDYLSKGSSRILLNGKLFWVGLYSKGSINSLVTKLRSALHPGVELSIQEFKKLKDHGQWTTVYTSVVK